MPETFLHYKENRLLLLEYWLKKSRYAQVFMSSAVCRYSLRRVSALLNTEAGHDFTHSGSVNVCPLVLWFFCLTAFNSVKQCSLSADWSSPGRHGNVSWTEPRAWWTASCQIIVLKFNNQTTDRRRGFYISVKDWWRLWNDSTKPETFRWTDERLLTKFHKMADILHKFLFWWVEDVFADLLILSCCLIVWRFDGCCTCFSVLILCLEIWTPPPAGPGLYEFMDLCDMYETSSSYNQNIISLCRRVLTLKQSISVFKVKTIRDARYIYIWLINMFCSVSNHVLMYALCNNVWNYSCWLYKPKNSICTLWYSSWRYAPLQLFDSLINKEVKKKREQVLTLTTPEPFFCSSYKLIF